MPAPSKLACAAALVALIACSSKGDDGAKPGPPQDKDAAPAVNPADARVGVADAGFAKLPDDPFAPIGVAECDAYIKKQRECVDNHAPAGIKDQQLEGLGHIAARWRQVAAEGGNDYLLASCKALVQASKDATSEAWKCSW